MQFFARSAAASSGPPTAVRILDRRQATTPLLPAIAVQCSAMSSPLFRVATSDGALSQTNAAAQVDEDTD